MSLPDVQFTNNLGTTYFKQCLIGVTDSWEFDGRVSRHVKSISIDGHIQRGGANETLDNLATSRTTNSKRYGSDGTLTLPWTTLSGIRMTDLSIPVSNYLDWVPVQAAFADDYPDTNLYTLSFFGFTLYNPRLSIPMPNRQLKDDYPHMPWMQTAFAPQQSRNGVFRNRGGQRNMDLTLNGAIRVDDFQLPASLLLTLTQRNGLTVQFQNFNLPAGVPRPFNLGEAIPEIAADMNLAHCIVTRSTVVWQVEEQMAQLTIQMLCPPQLVGQP